MSNIERTMRRKRQAPPRFDQEVIDLIRCRVMTVMLASAASHEKEAEYERVWHLWFTRPDPASYELRTGNPPAEQDRPEHLKGMNLVLDMQEVPQEVWDEVRERVKNHARSRERLVESAYDQASRDNLVKPVQLARP